MAGHSKTRATAYMAMMSGAFIIAYYVAAKAVRDALFLSSFDVTLLPYMVIGASAFSLAAVVVSSRAMTRFTPHRLVPAAYACSAVVLLLVWTIVPQLPRLSAVLVYLQLVGFGPLLTSGFWSMVAESFDPRTAKDYVGRITGAGTLGGILGGLAAERVAAHYTVATMLPILASVHVVCAVLLYALHRSAHIQPETRRQAETAAGDGEKSFFHVLKEAGYLRTLATLVLLGTVSAAMIDYVFKFHASETYGRGESLLRFFALFYSGTGVMTFLLQTFLSGPALRKIGVPRTVGTLPMAVTMGGLGALVLPGLPSAGLARGLEAVFRGSLFRAGYELFYIPIPAREKRAVKSIVDVGFDRLGDAFGSGVVRLLLFLGPAVSSPAILTVAILVALVGLYVASRLQDAYRGALKRGLMERVEDLPEEELQQSVIMSGIVSNLSVMGDSSVILPSLSISASAPPQPPAAHPRAAPLHKSADTVVEAPPVGREALKVPPSASALADSVLQQIADLRSGDPERARKILMSDDVLAPPLIASAIQLLAWDEVSPSAIQALRRVADRHAGQLVDALTDAHVEFTIRRRLPRVLAYSRSQRALDGLMLGLFDRRFEVRFQCGRAVAVLHEARPELKVSTETIFEAIRKEVAVSRPVWESQRLLDRAEEKDASPFVDDFLRHRANRSLEHVFTLLSLGLPREPLRVAFRGLHTSDPHLRGTALEFLESILPSDIRERLWPLLEDRPPRPSRAEQPARPREEVLAELLQSSQSIMINLEELRKRTQEDSGQRS